MIKLDSSYKLSSITLRGVEVQVYEGLCPINDLKYWIDNPRVYTVVRTENENPTQELIEQTLQRDESVKQLSLDIQRNNGLIDPLVVNGETGEVVEGNRRLAACRILYYNDALNWGNVKVRVLEKNTNPSLINALLSSYHLKPKKNWDPYEKAFFLYRRNQIDKISIPELHKETALKESEIKKTLEVYKFMVEYNENDISKWSFYDSYLRADSVSRGRDLYGKELDDEIVTTIRGYQGKAQDFRKDVTNLAKKPKALKQFVEKKLTFDEAVVFAEDGGAGDRTCEKIQAFADFLSEPDLKKRIEKLDKPKIDTLQLQLKRIEQKLKTAQKSGVIDIVEQMKDKFYKIN